MSLIDAVQHQQRLAGNRHVVLLHPPQPIDGGGDGFGGARREVPQQLRAANPVIASSFAASVALPWATREIGLLDPGPWARRCGPGSAASAGQKGMSQAEVPEVRARRNRSAYGLLGVLDGSLGTGRRPAA